MRFKRSRRFLVVVAILIGLLVAARLYLPIWVTDTLNARMAQMGEYTGRVEGVDIHLWRGAYTIHGLRIDKRDADIPVPFFAVPQLDIEIKWAAVFDGGIVGSAVFWSPSVNIVDARGERGKQTGKGVAWRDQLEALIPVRLDEVVVHDGTVRFHNFVSDPPVDLAADQIEGSILNLTNVRDEDTASAASLDVTGRMLETAPMEAHGSFDPFEPLGAFRIALRITGIDVTKANDLLAAYVNLDVVSGRGEFVMELEAKDRQLDGYIKPLFHDVQVFSIEQDIREQGDNPLRVIWEALAGGIKNIFKNQAADQFATRIEISGRTDDPETSTWDAILAILRNAFVKAFEAEFENLPTRPDAD